MKKISAFSTVFLLAFGFFLLHNIDTKAQVCFSTAANFAVGSNPNSATCADFNADGIVDLVTTNYTSNNVSVILGVGNGSFGTTADFAVGTNPKSVMNADFNRDGIIDLAVANSSNNISILLGLGNGGFSAATNFAAGTNPNLIAVADFNGDTMVDLAITNYTTNNVSILLGSGTGSFGAATNFAVGINPKSLTCADFNGDGIADLAVANSSNNISILLGLGNGSFGAANNFAVGSGPTSITGADFNGDAIPDLAVANSVSSNVSVLLGVGNGTFGTAVSYAAGSFPTAVISADFNGDGIVDLAVANANSSNVSVLLGTGTGSFESAINFLAATPYSVASGDFNGDGRIDLATTNYSSNSVSVLLNQIPSMVNAGSDQIVCEGTAVILSGSGAVTYTWSNGVTDNTLFTPAVGSIIYSVTGTDVNGCMDTDQVVVTVNPRPIVNAGPDKAVCEGAAVTLLGGGANAYIWSNGIADGIPFLPMVTAAYIVSGTDANGCTNIDSIVVVVNPIDTTELIHAICEGSTYDFYGTLLTEVGIYSHILTSVLSCDSIILLTITINPVDTTEQTQTVCSGENYDFYGTHLTASGTYYAILNSSLNCDSVIKLVFTTNPLPDSSFTFSIIASTLTLTTPANPNVMYYWDFADGDASNNTNPQHIYAAEGYYKVCLTVIDNITSCQNNFCQHLLIGSPVTACLANFIYSSSANVISFVDSSYGSPTNWYWQFGDGYTDFTQNPQHNYAAAGYYTVTLTIFNASTQCMDTYETIITVGSQPSFCEASFSYFSDIPSRTLYFSNQSMGSNITGYFWNFGDGTTSTDINPIHAYTSNGYYTVCLSLPTCNNITCYDVKVGQDTIICNADFIYLVDTINRIVQYEDRTVGAPSQWNWDFGDSIVSTNQNDSHQFAANGFYVTSLIVINPEGCVSHKVEVIKVKGDNEHLSAGFVYVKDTTHKSGLYPYNFYGAIFGNAAKLIWDFGDGSPLETTTISPNHTYTAKGIYVVLLSVEDPIIGESDNYSRLLVIDTTVNIIENASIQTFSIFPNPANDEVTMQFYMPSDENVAIAIIDMYGKEVDKISQMIESGSKRIYWDAKNFAAGIYTISLVSKSNRQTKKLVLTH